MAIDPDEWLEGLGVSYFKKQEESETKGYAEEPPIDRYTQGQGGGKGYTEEQPPMDKYTQGEGGGQGYTEGEGQIDRYKQGEGGDQGYTEGDDTGQGYGKGGGGGEDYGKGYGKGGGQNYDKGYSKGGGGGQTYDKGYSKGGGGQVYEKGYGKGGGGSQGYGKGGGGGGQGCAGPNYGGEDAGEPLENMTRPFEISASVGCGGKNKPYDVEAVQVALNRRAHAGLVVDGKCGPKTIAAIKSFQATIGGFKPDGIIQPGRATARALAGQASSKGGEGDYGKGKGGGGSYGKSGGGGGYSKGGGGDYSKGKVPPKRGGGTYGKGGGGGYAKGKAPGAGYDEEAAVGSGDVAGDESEVIPTSGGDDGSGGSASDQEIGVTIENGDAITDIFLTVEDLNLGANTVIVARRRLNVGKRMPLTLQADRDGRGKIHWIAEPTDGPAGTVKEEVVERINSGQNISTGLM